MQPNDPDHTVEETITPAADPQDTIIDESLINEQVKQFEASLADNCPICKTGQVHPQKPKRVNHIMRVANLTVGSSPGVNHITLSANLPQSLFNSS